MEDLVVRAQNGDREAFASLVNATSDRLYAIATRILRDGDLAEDALQGALVTAWRQLPSLRDPARFEAWVRRLLVHACYAEARRRRSWTTNVRALPVDGPVGPDGLLSVIERDEARPRLPARVRRTAGGLRPASPPRAVPGRDRGNARRPGRDGPFEIVVRASYTPVDGFMQGLQTMRPNGNGRVTLSTGEEHQPDWGSAPPVR